MNIEGIGKTENGEIKREREIARDSQIEGKRGVFNWKK